MYRAKQIIAFLVLVFSAFSGRSQEISVGSFNLLPNDMTVRTAAPVFDANGDLAALIKVVTTAAGFDFDGGSLGIVKVDWQPGEVWVYVPPGARMLTIRHPQLGVLRNYAYPVSIASGNVYELRLVSGEIEVSVKERQILTEFVIIDSEPRNADVYLNNELVGKTTFSSAFPEGRYEWRLVSDLYLPEAGVFELKAGEKQKIAVKLKPNFGSIQVTSLPESGAKITLNGVKLGMATPYTMMEVPVGEHIITLTHESYETTTQKVVVSPGETEVLSIAMEPNFAELVVSAQDDEEVYINGVRRGTGRFSSRLAPGVYSVEVRKFGHRTATRQLSLRRGDQETVVLRPEPILGSIQVVSEPMEAEIYINGKLVGTTPQIVRDLVVGEYDLELRLEGYGTEQRKVQVKEGEIVTIDQHLPKGFEFEPEMVFVEGGKFIMGCTSEDNGGCGSDEKPAHEVEVSAFLIGKYEVTQAEWLAVMQYNPSHFQGCNDCPVENVNWNEVQDYISKLNQLTGKNYRLPMETEWEFAARGGNKSRQNNYAGSNDINAVSWYSSNSNNRYHPVGEKHGNELGLYDMSGNVWEWCGDWYGSYPVQNFDQSPMGGEASKLPFPRPVESDQSQKERSNPIRVENGVMIHKVMKGETLYGICREYAISINRLLEFNPNAQRGINPGMELRIPQKELTESNTVMEPDTKVRSHTLRHAQQQLDQNTPTSSQRVMRGGSWDRYPRSCRVSSRYYDLPENRNINRGFRLVLSYP